MRKVSELDPGHGVAETTHPMIAAQRAHSAFLKWPPGQVNMTDPSLLRLNSDHPKVDWVGRSEVQVSGHPPG